MSFTNWRSYSLLQTLCTEPELRVLHKIMPMSLYCLSPTHVELLQQPGCDPLPLVHNQKIFLINLPVNMKYYYIFRPQKNLEYLNGNKTEYNKSLMVLLVHSSLLHSLLEVTLLTELAY
jgi:hypothetical protein